MNPTSSQFPQQGPKAPGPLNKDPFINNVRKIPAGSKPLTPKNPLVENKKATSVNPTFAPDRISSAKGGGSLGQNAWGDEITPNRPRPGQGIQVPQGEGKPPKVIGGPKGAMGRGLGGGFPGGIGLDQIK